MFDLNAVPLRYNLHHGPVALHQFCQLLKAGVSSTQLLLELLYSLVLLVQGSQQGGLVVLPPCQGAAHGIESRLQLSLFGLCIVQLSFQAFIVHFMNVTTLEASGSLWRRSECWDVILHGKAVLS
eukprot:CAMPEP_0202909210 /NCGR_PEP_ID=MMETSP1392-20130828/48662_1 /ASSEMBLY_ACC=CAM_ASM_000868 /TAXON_ID=225041 /ORGANISM="Chlamydomonas chlamydogama, Strain SAG 11-48b" /LENGTH=124 /DNA_ID=CAMNT_0049598889 /DNA_START=719 /DNA_END=1093 /DNA_ORIENTATION=-